MNVTLKQLRAFVRVAHERSFTRAAKTLHVTQSTLTSTIQNLESEIGMRVFDRSTRACELTPQGVRFLPAAERLLRDLGESLDEMRQVVDLQRGSVAIAAAASFINFVLAQAVVDVARAHPAIGVRLVEDITSGVCRRVRDGEVDFGVTSLFRPEPDLDVRLILVDDYGVVCSPRHPLAAADGPVPWSALAPHTMISLHPSSGIRAIVEQHPRVPTRCKQPLYEVGSMSSLLPLLRRQLGCAALPMLAAQPLVAGGLVYRALTRPVVRRRLCVVTRKGRSPTPAARVMLDAMFDAVAGLEPRAEIRLAARRRDVR